MNASFLLLNFRNNHILYKTQALRICKPYLWFNLLSSSLYYIFNWFILTFSFRFFLIPFSPTKQIRELWFWKMTCILNERKQFLLGLPFYGTFRLSCGLSYRVLVHWFLRYKKPIEGSLRWDQLQNIKTLGFCKFMELLLKQ